MEVPESNHEFKVVDDDENRKYQKSSSSILSFSKQVEESFINEDPKERHYTDEELTSIDSFSELSQLMFDNNYDTFVRIIKGQPGVVKMTDYAGNSLLMLSAFWGKNKFCEFLLDINCDPNIVNVTKMNALDIALQWGRPEIAQKIVEVNGSTGIFTRIKGLVDTINFRKYIYQRYFTKMEDLRENLETNLLNMTNENLKLKEKNKKLTKDLEAMTAKKNKFEKESIEYRAKSELLESQLTQALENNKRLRHHNYKLKDEAFKLNKSLKAEFVHYLCCMTTKDKT